MMNSIIFKVYCTMEVSKIMAFSIDKNSSGRYNYSMDIIKPLTNKRFEVLDLIR